MYITLLILLLSTSVWAAPAQIMASVNNRVAKSGSVDALLGEEVTLYVAIRRGRVWYSDAPRLQNVSRRRVKPLSALGEEISVQWFKVEPRPFHVNITPPNEGNPAYSNSVLFGPNHGKWLGYDTLEYLERPVEGETSSQLIFEDYFWR